MNTLLDLALSQEVVESVEKTISTYLKAAKYFEKNYNSIHPDLAEIYNFIGYFLREDG